MKTILLFLVCSLLAGAACLADPYVHAATGIALPDQIAGMTRRAVSLYGDSGADSGVAIPYEKGDVMVTVFIHHNASTADYDKFTSAAQVVDESLAAIQKLEESGVYSDVKISSSKDDSATTGWAKGEFTGKVSGTSVVSLVYATLKGEYYVKLRITTPGADDDSIQKFVTELQKIVDASKVKP